MINWEHLVAILIGGSAGILLIYLGHVESGLMVISVVIGYSFRNGVVNQPIVQKS